jgi:hypothetical protein
MRQDCGHSDDEKNPGGLEMFKCNLSHHKRGNLEAELRSGMETLKANGTANEFSP